MAKQILLIEDHADLAFVMSRLIQKMGYQVHIATTVAEAISFTQVHSLDLIISDLSLPDGSGLDVMRSLRERKCAVQGICLSGYSEELEQASQEAGFARYLTKGSAMDELEKSIVELIGR